MSKIVSHFGLHKDVDDFLWLVQKKENLSAVGLPSNECPFVARHASTMCPHNFDFRETNEDLLALYLRYAEKSELLRLLSPTPEEDVKAVYVVTEKASDFMVLTEFMHLCAPSGHPTMYQNSARGQKLNMIETVLNNSNLSRFLIYGFEQKHPTLVRNLIGMFSNRQGRIILAGAKLPLYGLDRFVKFIPFDPQLISLLDELKSTDEIKRMGTSALRHYMRTHG